MPGAGSKAAWAGTMVGGWLATLGAGALTFLAVVVGWVFFRADSFTTAVSMLQGMAGMHGVSLPTSLEGRVGALVGSHYWLIFEGIHPLANFSSLNAVVYLSLGFLIVWLMPNVHQMFLRYRPVCEDGEGAALATKPAAIPQGMVAKNLNWTPTTTWAVPLALLFFLCFISLTKVSEFLYFQF